MSAPRETVHAWKQDPHGLGSLVEFCNEIILPSRPSEANRRNYRSALSHLTKSLGHAPAIVDLTSPKLCDTVELLTELHRSRDTVKQVREILLSIAREAYQHELITRLPVVPISALPPKPSRDRVPMKPWSPSELERLFGSARTIPGDVAGIPACRWWPAFLIVLIDTQTTISGLMPTLREAYDVERGELCAGLFRYQLHPLAVDAVNAILPHSYEKLFPWPWDSGRPPYHILFRRFKQLLFRADLPHVTGNLFERLRITSRNSARILECLNFSAPFKPRMGKPHFPRARDRRRWEQQAAQETLELEVPLDYRGPSAQKNPKQQEEPLLRITFDTSTTLLHFTQESYIPQRLADGAALTVQQYLRTVERFSVFLACDATFHALEEDIVERFLAWLKKSGLYENATINGYRACVLALWKHAWRKRKVKELPRDINKLKISKRVPDAWSLDEVRSILVAAQDVEGDVCGIPAPLFWTALVLTLYDTGLRIAAVMQTRVEDFDIESRWLKIPAEVQKQDADQVFRLPDETVTAIMATNPVGREWLFPWPYDSTDSYPTLTRHYRKILKAAGLKASKRDLFHKLRRTSATAVCQVLGKQAAQQHLGHSNMSVTERYIDPTKIVGIESPSERIPRPLPPALGSDFSRNHPSIVGGVISDLCVSFER